MIVAAEQPLMTRRRTTMRFLYLLMFALRVFICLKLTSDRVRALRKYTGYSMSNPEHDSSKICGATASFSRSLSLNIVLMHGRHTYGPVRYPSVQGWIIATETDVR